MKGTEILQQLVAVFQKVILQQPVAVFPGSPQVTDSILEVTVGFQWKRKIENLS